MAADATQAILGFQPPKIKSAFERSQEQTQNALGQMQVQNAFDSRQAGQRAMQDDAAAREAYQASGGDLAKARELLYGKGLYKQGAVVDKQIADQGEAKAKLTGTNLENAKKKTDLFGQAFGYLKDNPTKENAVGTINQLLQTGAITPEEHGKFMSTMPDDPAQIGQLATQFFQGAIDAAKQLPDIKTQNNGGTNDIVAVNPITQKATNVSSTPITQSADNLATNTRTAADNEASRNVQIRGQNITARGQNLTDQRARDKNSIDANGAASTASGIVDMGLPKPANTPWIAIKDPKQRAIAQGRTYAADSKELNKSQEEVDKAKSAAQDAERFMALNKNVGTGGLLDRTGAGRFLTSFGADNAEMQSLSAKAAPGMRPVGAGATSDFDAKQYEKATFGVDKPATANRSIADAIKAKAQNLEDYQEFRQNYLEQNGTLQGSDRYWKEYASKNPILDPTKPGTYTLNAKRKSWRDHFANGNADLDPVAAEMKRRGL